MTYAIGDGADKKIARIDALKAYIIKAGPRGRTLPRTLDHAERNLGLNPKTAKSYLQLLRRTGEIKEHDLKFYGVNQYNKQTHTHIHTKE